MDKERREFYERLDAIRSKFPKDKQKKSKSLEEMGAVIEAETQKEIKRLGIDDVQNMTRSDLVLSLTNSNAQQLKRVKVAVEDLSIKVANIGDVTKTIFGNNNKEDG